MRLRARMIAVTAGMLLSAALLSGQDPGHAAATSMTRFGDENAGRAAWGFSLPSRSLAGAIGAASRASFAGAVIPTDTLTAEHDAAPETGPSSSKVAVRQGWLHLGYNVPRWELFAGYSYLRAVPELASNNRMVWLNGGSTSLAFNINRHFGMVADFGGFDASELRLTGAGANPAGVSDAGGNAFTYLFGPRVSYRKPARLTPFAQALFGVTHASEVTLSNCTGVNCTPLPVENAFTMTAGGGLDWKVRPRIAVRVVQAEYLMTRFADLTTGYRQIQNDVRLSAGVVFGFGAHPRPRVLILSYGCSLSPASVYAGDPIAVTGIARDLNPGALPTYAWSSDGVKISGTTATASIDTTGLNPGTYAVKGTVNEGAGRGQSADCTASFIVMPFGAPSISCSANPQAVASGEPSTITAVATSPQNRPLTYSYSTSAGTISGAGATATLNTAAVSPGNIAVLCNATDDRQQKVSASTVVTVLVPRPPPTPVTQKLCSINFTRDKIRPTRVDNEAKACLDGISLDFQSSADARLAIIGNETAKERADGACKVGGANAAAAQRAVNVKHYLVSEKGMDPSRIVLYTGSADSQTVDTMMVPAGANLDMTGLTAVDESALQPVPRTTPKKVHRSKQLRSSSTPKK